MFVGKRSQLSTSSVGETFFDAFIAARGLRKELNLFLVRNSDITVAMNLSNLALNRSFLAPRFIVTGRASRKQD